jgi:arsenate reductase-like glutaredoxin family protein
MSYMDLSDLIETYTVAPKDPEDTEPDGMSMGEEKKTVPNFMTLYKMKPADDEMDKIIEMLVRHASDLVISNWMFALYAYPNSATYFKHLDEIKKHGSPYMKDFVKVFMEEVGALNFSNKLAMETLLHKAMTKRNVWSQYRLTNQYKHRSFYPYWVAAHTPVQPH